MPERGYIPFGEYKPDLRYLVNDGLLKADGVVPAYQNYITSPELVKIVNVGGAATVPQGLHCHHQNGNSYVMLSDGVNGRIFQVTPAGVVTDVSRGALYAAPIPPFGGATGCSFGTSVIMTNLLDPVQFQVAGAGAFANMITSAFAPNAQFCFPLRGNLFLARCTLAAPYDTLAAGANENLVAWSQTENIRAFGSKNIDPQITGCGYQPLNFDIGDIRCAKAGADYGIIGHSNGIARVDGPPYTFRVVARNIGLAFPYGAAAVRDDIYFMSASGLARLPGGEGPVEVLGAGKWLRSLIDNSTGFSDHPASIPISVTAAGAQLSLEPFVNLSMAYDAINDLLITVYTISGDTSLARGMLAYNIGEDRCSFFQLFAHPVPSPPVPSTILFLQSSRQGDVSSWGIGRDIRFVEGSVGAGQQALGKMILGSSGMDAVLQKGYIQFKTDRTTRLLRVRPIYNVSDQNAAGLIQAKIESTNKPYATPTTYGTYSTLDSHGWIVTPSTVHHDFHSVRFDMTWNGNMHKVIEYEGFEYEIEDGPPYSA